ncbi:signal peptidase II [Roseovarius spongiae]|uniref:Lipoprotein signal peptidase n=2 Tax=Roseovarius spongiae TaxID=2320272 RepID=A0A3A8AQC3_9RHOB|nr:signal peptidase II [Roseovarius spongiae]
MAIEKPSLRIGMFAALAALAVDQGTKAMVVANAAALSPGVPVLPGFNLTFLRNDGVTFGLFGSAPWWSLVVVALGICIWLAVLMVRATSRVEALAYGAIIGGALGNIVDRLQYRAVTDFLDFYIESAHWPAFNMADVFVVGGVGLLLVAPWLAVQRQTGP